jgi:hypothetical protein
MQGKTDLSYFPENPYRYARSHMPLSPGERRMVRKTWTTAPAWWIQLRRVFLRCKPRPEPPFALTPWEPPPPR